MLGFCRTVSAAFQPVAETGHLVYRRGKMMILLGSHSDNSAKCLSDIVKFTTVALIVTHNHLSLTLENTCIRICHMSQQRIRIYNVLECKNRVQFNKTLNLESVLLLLPVHEARARNYSILTV